jgi:hypothetical protein
MADRKGSAARLAPYRDGGLSVTKFAGKGHWEAHLAGDELIHVVDGTHVGDYWDSATRKSTYIIDLM